MKRGDNLLAGILDRAAGRQQLRGVGDKARVIELPEVLTLRPERRTMARIIAAVLPGIQEDNAGRGKRIPGRAGLGDQQAIRLQARAMNPRSMPQQPQAQRRRHVDGAMNISPAPQ